MLCSQCMSVIIPVASPEVYSPMSLVELVRGAVSSTQQQQNTAAPQQTIIRSLDQVLCPVYARQDQPDVDALPLDRKHNGEEGRGKAMESKLNLNFQHSKFPIFNKMQISINSDVVHNMTNSLTSVQYLTKLRKIKVFNKKLEEKEPHPDLDKIIEMTIPRTEDNPNMLNPQKVFRREKLRWTSYLIIYS